MPCDQNTLSDIIFLPCASLCFVMWVLDVENVESLRFFQVLRLLVIVCASGELKAAFETAHRGFDDAIGWFTCAAFTIALQMYGLYVSKFCFVAFKVKHVFFIFLKQYLHSTKTVSFFFFLFFCRVVEAGCSPGHWSGWRECRIIGAMLDLVSVALQCWGSGTWKHWLNSYQSFQTPSWRKASWASFLSGPRPVEVQRDGEACRAACVCVCLCVRTAFERE